MGFFDDLSGPEPDEDDLPEVREQPGWTGRPRGWIGGVVPLELLMAKNDSAAVYLSGFVAYPTGFSLAVNTLGRSEKGMRRMLKRPWREPIWPHDLDDEEIELAGQELPPELLRFGLQCPDGRKASTYGSWLGGASTYGMAMLGERDEPDPEKDLMLTSGGGSGSGDHTEQTYLGVAAATAGRDPIRLRVATPRDSGNRCPDRRRHHPGRGRSSRTRLD